MSSSDTQTTEQRRKATLETLRENALDAREESRTMQIEGYSKIDSLGRYRAAVGKFLRAAINIIAVQDAEPSADYVDGVHIGTVVVSPPAQLKQLAENNLHRLPSDQTVPEPKQFPVVGLRGFTKAPSPYEIDFTVTMRNADEFDQHTDTSVTEMDRQTIENAFELGLEALADVGIDLSLSTRQTTIDKELLLEVAEWRDENV